MKSYLFIVPVSAAIALAMLGPLLWHLHKELARGWKETFGIATDDNALVKARTDALREAEPMRLGAGALLFAIMFAAICILAVAMSNGGFLVLLVGAILIIALIVLFNIVLFAQLPSFSDSAGVVDTGSRTEPQKFRLSVWWLGCAVVCLLLLLGGFGAAVASDPTTRLALGVPGAVGLIGLGLWSRHSRMQNEAA